MAGEFIKVDDAEVIAALQRLYAAAGNLTPVYKNIGEYETSATKSRFLEEKDPDGIAWQDLNPLYASTKKGPGKLRGETRSLSSIIYQVADDGVEIGSNAVYARIHNEGGVIKPKNASALVFSMGGQTFKVKSVTMPKRTFLGFSNSDIAEIQAIIQDHFEDASVGDGN
ncbi:phage virion morphogenesis protein [Rhizobium skierniewicense]|uniref:phage virion morphogenesis protein n=1 Tax=Rhizobium skierniewicense TaxID=984260 RepID=UPI001FAC4B3B|nr:phage virion morphogenesis protein [Rhizobium skierniewicense]MCI9864888.1 phage virion morphogenesis protein [Rhizobium skierniewicense]